jgi:DUF2075 family protein
MIVYKGSASEFDYDVRYNKITNKLESEFIRILGRKVSDSERRSFRNSLSRMNEILINEKLVKKDCGILVEYQLPSSSMRLDFMITGRDKFMNKNAVIVELKQWDKVQSCETQRQVYTYTGGAYREVNHPAVQVSNYKSYLEDYHSAFHRELEDSIDLYACSYLHNYNESKNDELINDKFQGFMEQCPVFTADNVDRLGSFIKSSVEKGDGLALIDDIEKAMLRPSKKLIDYVNEVIDAKSEFTLMGEQLVIFDRVMQLVKDRKLDGSDGHFVVLVKGGPGTGKSVVGLNLLGKILKDEKECAYLAANAAFKNGMIKKLKSDRVKALFKHPYTYNEKLTKSDQMFQTVIIDEAHRLSTTPPPMKKKLENTLVEEIIKRTHLSVFFTDDNQMIRPNDIGSYVHIKESAEKQGCTLFEYELDAQFRCAGSEGYLNWLDDVLGIRNTANASGWENLDNLEFHIVDDPNDMKKSIVEYQNIGFNSRIVAGYAWDWSKDLKLNGELYNDVKIYKDEDVIFAMPWNPQSSYKGQKRGANIPKDTVEWATDPCGVNQIGCIHTCQGLDFDYVGVIIGDEFTYNLEKGTWEADVSKCYDKKIGKNSKDKFLRLAQNTYKTLLTRGVKGVWVYSVDEDTRTYLKQRLGAVKEGEHKKFYHQKNVNLDELFSRYNILVAEDAKNEPKEVSIKLEKYSISPIDDKYFYCDVVEERLFYDQITKHKKLELRNVEDDVLDFLQKTPQVRYFSQVYEGIEFDLGIIKIQPIALVRRMVKDEVVLSVVFEK